MKLNAKELRNVGVDEVQEKLKTIKRRPLYFILENIYDTYNIGGLFRLADAIGVKKMYLCGEMETPPNHKIKKASIGTYKVVEWEYRSSAKEAIAELHETYNIKHKTLKKDTNSSLFHASSFMFHVYAVEQSHKSIDYRKIEYKLPLALVFGNETYGVTPQTLDFCDEIAEIPMFGVNKSLNVIVSAAIVSYEILRYLSA